MKSDKTSIVGESLPGISDGACVGSLIGVTTGEVVARAVGEMVGCAVGR